MLASGENPCSLRAKTGSQLHNMQTRSCVRTLLHPLSRGSRNTSGCNLMAFNAQLLNEEEKHKGRQAKKLSPKRKGFKQVAFRAHS